MPRFNACQCGCGGMTRSNFVVGHFALHRTALLRLRDAGDSEAYNELRERGWLPEQGYGSYGTGRNVGSERNGNRQSRRSTQRVRSIAEGGQFVPDNTIAGYGTGPTRHRAAIAQPIARLMQVVAPTASPATDRTVADNPVVPTFGVEIEFIGSQSAVAAALRSAGLRCEAQSYNHRDNADGLWKIVDDASVRGDANTSYESGELVSPILSGTDGFKMLRLACDALVSAGARVNQTCGVHVHHGASGTNVTQRASIAEAYTNAQRLIDSIMPRHRVNNTYAMPYTYADIADLRSDYVASRYHTVNLDAFRRHRTVEFRQHNGTLSYQAIANWVRFGQRLIAAVLGGTAIDYSGLPAFLGSIECEPRTIEYYCNRQMRMAQRTR